MLQLLFKFSLCESFLLYIKNGSVEAYCYIWHSCNVLEKARVSCNKFFFSKKKGCKPFRRQPLLSSSCSRFLLSPSCSCVCQPPDSSSPPSPGTCKCFSARFGARQRFEKCWFLVDVVVLTPVFSLLVLFAYVVVGVRRR